MTEHQIRETFIHLGEQVSQLYDVLIELTGRIDKIEKSIFCQHHQKYTVGDEQL